MICIPFNNSPSRNMTASFVTFVMAPGQQLLPREEKFAA